MADDRPYLSVVVTARNDNHGGDLLGRMQAFVNGWIAQSKRHRLASELIFVEWNPPQDRPPLVDALRWPKDLGSCRVRIIQVSPHLHRRYAHAEALPLYQMMAKNAGIRRARGRFVLATNIDIIFSDELVGFLAEGKLEPRRMYRIDRHDVMPEIPVDGIDEQLAYCRAHLIRINAREGTFNLTPQGRRALSPSDIAGPDSGITFGRGWFPVESASTQENFRWATTCSELLLAPPFPGVRDLRLDMEPGPGAGNGPLEVLLTNAKGEQFAQATLYDRGILTVPLKGIAGEAPFAISFRVLNGGRYVPLDTRILEFRVFRCDWSLDIQEEPTTVTPPGEIQAQECNCEEEIQAEAIVPPPAPEVPTQECDGEGETQTESIALPPPPEIQTQVCNCEIETQPEPIALPPPPQIQTQRYDGEPETRGQSIGQSSIPVGRVSRPPSLWERFQRFLAMVARGDDIILVPVAVWPWVKRILRLYVDNGGFTGLLRLGFRRQRIAQIAATPGSAISANPQSVHLQIFAVTPPIENTADAQKTPIATIDATPLIENTADAQQALVEAITVAPPIEKTADAQQALVEAITVAPPVENAADAELTPIDTVDASPPVENIADAQRAPINTIAVTPPIEISATLRQAQLHTNGCGDFTLMALEDWLDLRGYPEFDTFSMHLDSIFCFSAHHAGVVEEVLEEPMRIYHIEHGAGSGWTPEGQAKLFARIAERGLSMIENPEVIGWAKQMQKLRCPMIFNLENWGLADFNLPETTVASSIVKSA